MCLLLISENVNACVCVCIVANGHVASHAWQQNTTAGRQGGVDVSRWGVSSLTACARSAGSSHAPACICICTQQSSIPSYPPRCMRTFCPESPSSVSHICLPFLPAPSSLLPLSAATTSAALAPSNTSVCMCVCVCTEDCNRHKAHSWSVESIRCVQWVCRCATQPRPHSLVSSAAVTSTMVLPLQCLSISALLASTSGSSGISLGVW